MAHPPITGELTDEQRVAVDWCLEQAAANPDQFLAELANRLRLSAAQKHRLALVLERGPRFETMHVLGGSLAHVNGRSTYTLRLQVPVTGTLHRLEVIGCPHTAIQQVVTGYGAIVAFRSSGCSPAVLTLCEPRRLLAGHQAEVRLIVDEADLPYVTLPISLRGILEVARGPAGEVIDHAWRSPGIDGPASRPRPFGNPFLNLGDEGHPGNLNQRGRDLLAIRNGGR